jgi:hypothetical protein
LLFASALENFLKSELQHHEPSFSSLSSTLQLSTGSVFFLPTTKKALHILKYQIWKATQWDFG